MDLYSNTGYSLAPMTSILLSAVLAFGVSNSLASESIRYIEIRAPLTCEQALEKLYAGRQDPLCQVFVYPCAVNERISRSFEREGQFFADIESIFPLPLVSRHGDIHRDLILRLNQETYDGAEPILAEWLQQYPTEYRGVSAPESYLLVDREETIAQWPSMLPHARLEALFEFGDLRKTINKAGWAELFQSGVLEYDYLRPGRIAGHRLMASNSENRYEIKLEREIADRNAFLAVRAETERRIRVPIGQQHIFNRWPDNKFVRQHTATRYAEMLRSLNWLVYWSTVANSIESSIRLINNRYIGVSHDIELAEIAWAYLQNDPSPFFGKSYSGKFRLVAQRAFLTRADTTHPDFLIPSIELRAGNSIRPLRAFVEDQIEARLASADYSGLRDFMTYRLFPMRPMNLRSERSYAIGGLKTKAADRDALAEFVKKNGDVIITGKLLGPLLAWEKLFPELRGDLAFQQARGKYLQVLFSVVRRYAKQKPFTSIPLENYHAKQLHIASVMGPALNEFANATGLARKYEAYLTP